MAEQKRPRPAKKTTKPPDTVKAVAVKAGDRIRVRGMDGIVLTAESYAGVIEIWWRADGDDDENRRLTMPFADEDVTKAGEQ